MSCPACDKFSGHPRNRCPESLHVKWVEIPADEAEVLNTRFRLVQEALARRAERLRKEEESDETLS